MHLTPHQFELLRVLARNEGKLLTHRMILQEVWGPGYGSESNLLHVHVSQLRRKIEPDPARPRYLLTEPGAGLPARRSRRRRAELQNFFRPGPQPSHGFRAAVVASRQRMGLSRGRHCTPSKRPALRA